MSNKVVLDNKRRGSFGADFSPGDTFLREIHGQTVTFKKLRPVEPPLVRARKKNGRWIGAAVKPTCQAILEAIRIDRESQ